MPLHRCLMGVMVIGWLSLSLGCGVVNGPESFENRAKRMQLVRENVETSAFRLATYTPKVQPAGKVLHVYLAGDGLPWVLTYVVNKDPTVGAPLMLQLMGLDQNHPRVYVARPCYNGFATQCGGSTWWTFSRHHPRIVKAMSDTIERYRQQHGFEQVRLLGHSGGGALAMLIAARLPEPTVEAVLTVAGNLDLEAWTTHHGYTPLYSSTNPAKQPALPKHIRQWHLLGGRDNNILPKLAMPWLLQAPEQRRYTLYPQQQHRCCWVNEWRSIIRALSEGVSGEPWAPPERAGL